jgi:hypothetical protein
VRRLEAIFRKQRLDFGGVPEPRRYSSSEISKDDSDADFTVPICKLGGAKFRGELLTENAKAQRLEG